jgi:hypothetical protein
LGGLLAQLSTGRRWRPVIDEEFRSLTPQIADRDEVALVGSTILGRQVTEFGAVVRPIPLGLHRGWERSTASSSCWRFIRAARRVPRTKLRPCSKPRLRGWSFAADSDDRRQRRRDISR